MSTTKIEWTDSVWNPVTGCTKISPGCFNCYAERMSKRLKLMGQDHYRNGFNVTIHEDSLSLPLQWKKPKMIFVNSMSDLFHDDVPSPFIEKIFRTMRLAHWHIFQVLTKRSERLLSMAGDLEWPDNVWMGVSVENCDYQYRMDHLRNVPATVRFISMEPLLGPVPDLNLTGIHWVIVGGESGPGARPMDENWVCSIQRQCESAGTPFFFKQWGGPNKKKAGRLLKDQIYSEMPSILQERQTATV